MLRGGERTHMDVVTTFGNSVDKLMLSGHVTAARRLLLAGYHAQNLMFKRFPKKNLPPSKRYVSYTTMDAVIRALEHPQDTAMVSIFVPTEPLAAAGITPYSVETLSGYLAGAKAQGGLFEVGRGEGIPETLCSFHRAFIGAAELDLLPAPRFMVYTNLACDANMLTFPFLREHFDVPAFFIDVPYEKSDESVENVATQLREMCDFVTNVTGRRVDDQALRTTLARSKRTLENTRNYLGLERRYHLPGDLTSEMYGVFMNHIFLGTEQAERFSEMLLDDILAAEPSDALRLLWIHLIPYMQPSMRKLFNYNDRVFITSCELAHDNVLQPIDLDHPFESMAHRMVYSCYNGDPQGRIDQALELARRTGADGAVIFTQWGCKQTIGASGIIRDELERAGLPTLVLDGDGCDVDNNSDGQLTTRLGAFLEMLEERRP
jgi:benzoyl-CoA reductase/2-hydroxyglutaryl-CoA dehydratase subunit BcrC/BadD/HgdB